MTRHRCDAMAVQRYDIELDGRFVERHWAVVNAPVSDADGVLRWVVHHVEDVTAGAPRTGRRRGARRTQCPRSQAVLREADLTIQRGIIDAWLAALLPATRLDFDAVSVVCRYCPAQVARAVGGDARR